MDVSSVDTMCQKIIEEAQAEADKLLSRAKTTADQRLKLAEQEAKSKAAKEHKQAQAQADHIRTKTLSSVAVEKQRIILEKRGELIQHVMEEIATAIRAFSSSKQYASFLKQSIIEALSALDTDKATIMIGEKDIADVVEKALNELKKELPSQYKLKVTLELDKARHGQTGVIVTGADNQIRINNTLEERLAIQEDDIRRHIHERLFGEGDNRG